MNLEHLDDPKGFVPDDGFRAAVRRDGRRRRTRRRLALATGSVLTSVAVLVAALAGYGLWRTSRIDRVDVEFVAPPVDLDEPFNVLLIGSDAREGEEAEVVRGARSDTMIVVRVLPAERRLVLMSLPRDLVVTPLTGGAPQRLNTAFTDGGAANLVATVETRLGIPLSAYVEIDFRGLVDLVDEVGGLPLSVHSPVRDRSTGLVLDPSPCAVLDGEQALALLRSRHLESVGFDGTWREDVSAELGRMTRQRAVMAALLPRLASASGSLGGVDAALDLAADHMTIDDRLENADLLALGRWLTEGPGPELGEVVLPVVDATTEGGARVLALWPEADEAVGLMGGSIPPVELEESADIVASQGADGFSPVTDAVGHVPIGPCG